MDVGGWLRQLGLGQYEAAFRENAIEADVLPELTEAHLEKLGLPLGHRMRLLKAIANLGASENLLKPAPAPPQAADSAERRQVTVMFTDLVGSTALSARMDPEDLRTVIGAYHKCVAETVTRFDGFVAKYMGDGVLVYFGYPQAHEDDAERAVRAGLALVDVIASIAAPEELRVRIGIATGVVVVGDIVGSGEAQERGIVVFLLAATHGQRALPDHRPDGTRRRFCARRCGESKARQTRCDARAGLDLHPGRVALR
jgi:Adenylate and Guanylate cyclase catalytic domain/SAM domain (Sterile alpha motif)